MYRLFILATLLASLTHAATLEKLTLDDMILKSTDIVRAKVSSASTSFRGVASRSGMIYTHYTIDVSERYKGSPATRMDVAVPGGLALGYQQVFPGAPALKAGDEFVFFLWTSRTGLTQIIGLSQGLFTLTSDAAGKLTAGRNASSELMLDRSGNPVSDDGIRISLSALKARISAALGRGDQ